MTMNTFSVLGFVMMGLLLAKAPSVDSIPATIPPLNYSCSMDGNVTLYTTNLHGIFTAYAVGPYKNISSFGNSNSKCLASITNISSTNAVKLQNCNLTNPVTVYLMKDTLKSGTNSTIIGGKDFHEYNIKCNLPPNGINATAKTNFSVKDISSPTTVTKYFNPSPLTMTIEPVTAVIGQSLNVSIIEDYNEKFYILPKSCIATSGDNNTEKLEVLQSGKTQDDEVLTDFDVHTRGIASATVYAFRFMHSPTVNFACTVVFCENEKCITSAYNSSGRIRRGALAISPEKKYQVSASYRIVEPEQGQPSSSQSAVCFHSTMTIFFVFLATAVSYRVNLECFF